MIHFSFYKSFCLNKMLQEINLFINELIANSLLKVEENHAVDFE